MTRTLGDCPSLLLFAFVMLPRLLSGFMSNGEGDTVQVFSTHERNFTSIINPSLVIVHARLLIFAEARLNNGGDGDASRIGMLTLFLFQFSQ